MEGQQKNKAQEKRPSHATPPTSARARACITIIAHDGATLFPQGQRANERLSSSSALRANTSRVTLPLPMNPDKLFDYLEGRLPAGERAELEALLISDVQLQR